MSELAVGWQEEEHFAVTLESKQALALQELPKGQPLQPVEGGLASGLFLTTWVPPTAPALHFD